MSEDDELIERILQRSPVEDGYRKMVDRRVQEAPDHMKIKTAIFWYHPWANFEAPPKPMRLCFNPPGNSASTAKWKEFRLTLLEWIANDPSDLEWPLYLDLADRTLAVREMLPEKYRFWQTDEDYARRVMEAKREREELLERDRQKQERERTLH